MLVKYNPTVGNVLASCSGDQTVKVWDVEKSACISTFEGNPELTNDLAWSHTGDRLATSCKDKHTRIVDARNGVLAGEFSPHEGSKTVKLAYLGDDDHLLTVGFTKQSQREMKIWDLRNTAQPLNKVDIDQAAGVILPFFDPDTKIIWLSGKGDGNVRYYEYSDHDPWTFPLAEFRSTTSCKGVCVVPKRANDVMKCETARILKLTPNDGVQPLSFIVPRKSDAFQDDIFPDSAAGIAAHTADEWLGGSTKTPVLASLDPSKGGGVAGAKKPAMKTMASVSAELAAANKRISELEAKLKAAGIDC
jgi:coronin-1B/1C/6